jgi:hypothetical protein
MPPQQQYFLLVIDDDRTGSWCGSDQPMFQVTPVWEFDVRDADVQPRIGIDRLFRVNHPAHAGCSRNE